MKNLIICLAVLTFTFSFTSCSIVGAGIDYSFNKNYETHNERMEKYTTKSQVISKYGIPSQKDSYEGIEIWKYDLGGYTRTAAAATPIGNGVYGSSTSSYSNRYVEFHFRGDDTINWRSKGVDYAAPKLWFAMYTGMVIDSILLGLALGSV